MGKKRRVLRVKPSKAGPGNVTSRIHSNQRLHNPEIVVFAISYTFPRSGHGAAMDLNTQRHPSCDDLKKTALVLTHPLGSR